MHRGDVELAPPPCVAAVEDPQRVLGHGQPRRHDCGGRVDRGPIGLLQRLVEVGPATTHGRSMIAQHVTARHGVASPECLDLGDAPGPARWPRRRRWRGRHGRLRPIAPPSMSTWMIACSPIAPQCGGWPHQSDSPRSAPSTITTSASLRRSSTTPGWVGGITWRSSSATMPRAPQVVVTPASSVSTNRRTWSSAWLCRRRDPGAGRGGGRERACRPPQPRHRVGQRSPPVRLHPAPTRRTVRGGGTDPVRTEVGMSRWTTPGRPCHRARHATPTSSASRSPEGTRADHLTRLAVTAALSSPAIRPARFGPVTPTRRDVLITSTRSPVCWASAMAGSACARPEADATKATPARPVAWDQVAAMCTAAASVEGATRRTSWSSRATARSPNEASSTPVTTSTPCSASSVPGRLRRCSSRACHTFQGRVLQV